MLTNIFENLPVRTEHEEFTDLFSRKGVRIERIVSNGQSTGNATEFWPRVLANIGPPSVPEPTVTLVLPGVPVVDWKAKVELFEQLRREHEFGVGTIAGVAAKFGVHRRIVRRAIASALPPPHRYPARAKPKLDAVVAFIDKVLDADQRAPRKQRHTARRIHRRIVSEFPGHGGGVDGAQPYPRAQTADGAAAARDLRAAKLRFGTGSAGGLV